LRALLGVLALLVVIASAVLIMGVQPTMLRVFFFLHGTTNPLVLVGQQAPPAIRIAYGSGPLQFGELRVPDGSAKYPVAILVHGGCWPAKLAPLPETVTSLDLLRPLAMALLQARIASWNLEYRRLGNPGGGWPGTYQDLGRAADFLHDLAPGHNLDLSRVIAIGHSSGGQLALWLAARYRLPKTSPVYVQSPLTIKGVVNIDGPPDLEAFIGSDKEICGDSVVRQFLGGLPAEFPRHYQEGSASGLLPIAVAQKLFYSSKMVFMSGDENG
jgi:acetyl esterase/lipase